MSPWRSSRPVARPASRWTTRSPAAARTSGPERRRAMAVEPKTSPPAALPGPVRADGLVERIQRRHVLVREREVEDARVLLDALAVRRLRQDHEVALETPADQDLRGRAPEAVGDLPHAAVSEVATGAERAVGLDRHPTLLAGVEQSAAVLERAELHLVDDRPHLGDAEHLVQLRDAVVRDADRARVAARVGALHSVPGASRAALRPVDDVQVDPGDAEPLQASAGFVLRVSATGMELRGDEDLVPRHAAGAQRPPDARLVAVRLRRVDVAVAELQRPAHRLLALRALRDLPDAQAEERDLVAVGKDARPPVLRVRACRHSGLLPRSACIGFGG